MITAIVNLTIVEYANSIIFFKKHSDTDSTYTQMLRRKQSIKDCEEFFLYEYEYMTGGNGETVMKNLRTAAQERSTYVNRCWAKEQLE